MTSGSQTNVVATIELIAELVEEYCQRIEAGDSADPASFAALHPEHAAALRELLPAAAAMAALGRRFSICVHVRRRRNSEIRNARRFPDQA